MVNDLIASLIIAVVQGLTEWIPVSSSGHLVLSERLLGYGGGLMFDVALHFGTLMAVFVYFGSDIVDIVRDLFSGKWASENGRLGLLIIVATIPAALAGYFLQCVFETAFTSLTVVAFGFGITGMFLLIVSLSRSRGKNYGKKFRSELGSGEVDVRGKGKRFGFGKSFLVGVAQIFALFPGISRSGATIGSGMLLGLNEKNAIKFSFLMSIPIIFGANVLAIGSKTLPSSLIWATLVSFVVGLVTIHLLYGKMLVRRENLKWFGVYALVLAVIVGGYLLIS